MKSQSQSTSQNWFKVPLILIAYQHIFFPNINIIKVHEYTFQLQFIPRSIYIQVNVSMLVNTSYLDMRPSQVEMKSLGQLVITGIWYKDILSLVCLESGSVRISSSAHLHIDEFLVHITSWKWNETNNQLRLENGHVCMIK